MRRAVLVTALAVALGFPLASAHADETVVVPGLEFPSSDTYLTYFGCGDLYEGGQAPQVRIGRDGTPPAGTRSFGLLVPGIGTASGPVHLVDSVADTTVTGFSARSDAGADGVAYVWFVTPGLDPGQVWAGRAGLSVDSAWRYVDTASASYTWRLLDAATGDVVRDAGTATIGDFTDANGDGPGYLVAGLGCDGDEFSIDALRVGSPGAVTSYDLEGISVTVSMADPEARTVRVPEGTAVTLTGSALDKTGMPVGAPMVLQARPRGADTFRATGRPIPASSDGLVRTSVTPRKTTTYRWYLPDTGYAHAGVSTPVTVVVRVTGPEPAPADESSDPGQSAGDAGGPPGGQGGDSDENGKDQDVVLPPLPAPSEPAEEPTEGPTDEPADPPTEEPTEEPAEEPAQQPTQEPTGASAP